MTRLSNIAERFRTRFNGVPRVYLAHASEDHETLAKPLARALIANGIDVWFDEWEIRTGDSLRRKM